MAEKTKLNKSAWRLLLCIVSAVCLWLYVSYVENPDMTRRITNIPITITNEAKLNENSLAVKSLSKATVDIKVRAKRNLFTGLTADSIKATADVSTITQAGENMLTVNITFPSSASSSAQITDRSKLDITVYVEEYVTQNFTIEPNITSPPTNGYYVNSKVLANGDEMILSVSGCSSDIASIHHITTNEVDLSRATDNTVVPLTFVPVDSEGNVVENVTLASKRANANFEIYKECPIPLHADVIGDDEGIYHTLNPTAIYVKGPAASVDSMGPITVCSVNEYDHNDGDVLSFEIPLPEGITLRDGEPAIVDVIFSSIQ